MAAVVAAAKEVAVEEAEVVGPTTEDGSRSSDSGAAGARALSSDGVRCLRQRRHAPPQAAAISGGNARAG
jgi:hypothetical protein